MDDFENLETRESWVNASYTRRSAATYREQLQKEERELFALAQASADPKVACAAGRVAMLRQVVLFFEKGASK